MFDCFRLIVVENILVTLLGPLNKVFAFLGHFRLYTRALFRFYARVI